MATSPLISKLEVQSLRNNLDWKNFKSLDSGIGIGKIISARESKYFDKINNKLENNNEIPFSDTLKRTLPPKEVRQNSRSLFWIFSTFFVDLLFISIFLCTSLLVVILFTSQFSASEMFHFENLSLLLSLISDGIWTNIIFFLFFCIFTYRQIFKYFAGATPAEWIFKRH